MPELIEVEGYRRSAERLVGRRFSAIDVVDPGYLREGTSPGVLVDTLVGEPVTEVSRRGKVLLVHFGAGGILGLRFGMTGRLFVDGDDAVGPLLYSPAQPAERHVRIRFHLGDIAAWIVDPRRLGGVALSPDLSRVGPDVESAEPGYFVAVASQRHTPLKAVLLDQSVVSGLGNLLVDESLWRAGISPHRSPDSLEPTELGDLLAVIRHTVEDLMRRGGSNRGDLQPQRRRGGTCPRCGAALSRDVISGRTTWWCPAEQR